MDKAIRTLLRQQIEEYLRPRHDGLRQALRATIKRRWPEDNEREILRRFELLADGSPIEWYRVDQSLSGTARTRLLQLLEQYRRFKEDRVAEGAATAPQEDANEFLTLLQQRFLKEESAVAKALKTIDARFRDDIEAILPIAEAIWKRDNVRDWLTENQLEEACIRYSQLQMRSNLRDVEERLQNPDGIPINSAIAEPLMAMSKRHIAHLETVITRLQSWMAR